MRTGANSTAKLVFLDSTNLGVGPVSRVTLDQFVYVGEANGQKMTVNLVKGVFRFTTGALDKKAYTISTPTAAIGVRGTVLDIGVQSALTRVTLREGRALLCPRRPGITFEQQVRNCTRAAGGFGGSRCDCVDLAHAGRTAQVKKGGSASLTRPRSTSPRSVPATRTSARAAVTRTQAKAAACPQGPFAADEGGRNGAPPGFSPRPLAIRADTVSAGRPRASRRRPSF